MNRLHPFYCFWKQHPFHFLVTTTSLIPQVSEVQLGGSQSAELHPSSTSSFTTTASINITPTSPKMRVKSHGSNYKRFKRCPSFTNYQISIDKSSNIASLKNQCLAKLTQIISQSYDSQLHKFLPTELVESLMTHLAFQNLLNDRALLALASSKLTTLRLSNANKTIRPSPEAIDRAVKVSWTFNSLLIHSSSNCNKLSS